MGLNKFAGAEPALLAGYDGLKRLETKMAPEERPRLLLAANTAVADGYSRGGGHNRRQVFLLHQCRLVLSQGKIAGAINKPNSLEHKALPDQCANPQNAYISV